MEQPAAVNAPQSRRFADFADARQARSVWSARGFSAAFGRGEENSRRSPRDPNRRTGGRLNVDLLLLKEVALQTCEAQRI